MSNNQGQLISQTDYQAIESEILTTIDKHSDELISLSRTIHSNPETAYKEYKAAALLTEKLEEHGYQVQRKAADVDTAFIATIGTEPKPTIALLAEYDALPVLGHGCGHNLMCTATLGAGIALKQVMDRLPGRLGVYGTPAEEGGGGKVVMVNKGVFKGVDAAMIFHPASANMVGRSSLASTRLNIRFYGKASHAASAPDKGINALDGIIQTYNNANALRQHLRPDARVMGIITNGGQAANIVPDFASAHFSVRAADRAYADEVLEKFRRCAEAAALATGTRLEFEVIESSRYDNMVPNNAIGAVFAEKMTDKLGLELYEPESTGFERMGSTDMGNVSQVVPSLHPYLAIAPFGTSAHTEDFREAAYSDVGQQSMLNAAKALALTTLDLLVKPSILADAKREFEEQVSKGVCKGWN